MLSIQSISDFNGFVSSSTPITPNTTIADIINHTTLLVEVESICTELDALNAALKPVGLWLTPLLELQNTIDVDMDTEYYPVTRELSYARSNYYEAYCLNIPNRHPHLNNLSGWLLFSYTPNSAAGYWTTNAQIAHRLLAYGRRVSLVNTRDDVGPDHYLTYPA